jgi:hypothetical protein
MDQQVESTAEDPGREIAQRILGLQGQDETSAAFARRMGLSPQTVSNLRGGQGAGVGSVVAILRQTDISPRWLLTGEEPVRLVPESEARMRLWLTDLAVKLDPAVLEAAVKQLRDVGVSTSRPAADDDPLRAESVTLGQPPSLPLSPKEEAG